MKEEATDASLWLEAISGTERSFAVIFDRHRARVFRAAFHHMGGIADAEDVAAIVFLEAWRRRKDVRIVDGSLLPWLLVVTSNITLNFTRSQRRYRIFLSKLPRSPATDDHANAVNERLDSREQTKRISQALQKIAPGDRAVFQMCLVEELPLADVASALGIPIGTVKSRLHRARGKVRIELTGADISVETTGEIIGRT